MQVSSLSGFCRHLDIMDEAKTPAAMQAASSAPDAATKEVMDRMLRAVDLTQLRVHSDVRPPNFLGAGAEPVARTPASAPAASSACEIMGPHKP